MAKKHSRPVAAFFRSFFDEIHLFSYTNVDFLHKIVIILIEKLQKVFFFVIFEAGGGRVFWRFTSFWGVLRRIRKQMKRATRCHSVQGNICKKSTLLGLAGVAF